MSLTIKECLQLPSLRSATVIAGEKGLNRIVNAVSVLEITDEIISDFDHIDNGAICLSSFFNIKNDAKKQCQLILNMNDNGDACVVLYYVGIYLKEVDASVIDLANRLNFPILMMPENRADFFYSEVISDISDAIRRDKNNNKNYIDKITALVSTLPENRKTLGNLMRILSDNLQCSLLLTDTAMNNTALSTWPVSSDITPEEIVQLYNASVHDDEIMTTVDFNGQVLDIYKVRFTSFELRNHILFGVDALKKLTIDDMYQVIEILQIFSRLWWMDSENILTGRFISTVLEGDIKKASEIAARNHFNTSSVDTLVIIRPEMSGYSVKEQQQLTSGILKSVKSISGSLSTKVIIDAYSQYVVLFLPLDTADTFGTDLINNIDSALKDCTCKYTISPFFLENSLESIHKSYTLYNDCIEDAVKIFPHLRIISLSEILFCNRCRTILQERGEEMRIFKNMIDSLLANRESERLLETLQTYYLDCNCNIKETAQMLYTHRNTVQYRLSAIHSITKFKSGNSLDHSSLRTAAGCYRLSPDMFQS